MPALVSPYKGTAVSVVDATPPTVIEIANGVNDESTVNAWGDLGNLETIDGGIESQKEMQDARLTDLLRESAKKVMTKKGFTVGRDGKMFHCFMSHKKQHSRDGGVHNQIAQNFADSLKMFNFSSFLDIDSLSEISPEAIREGLAKSCSVVILINDETHESEWCQLEWKIAGELGLPCCVVVDMERANKSQEIKRAEAFPHLLQYQWIEYTGMKRREALEDITMFLTKHTLGDRKGETDDDQSETSSAVSSTRGDPRMHIYYKRINTLMMWGGLNLGLGKAADTSTSLKIWYVVVKISTYVCVGTCIFRLVYARGPVFTDHVSCLATVILHLHLIFAPLEVARVFRSKEIKLILAEASLCGTTAELMHQVFAASKILYLLGALLIPVALLLYVLAWEPLYFSAYYLGPQATTFQTAFGVTSGVLFFGGIVTHIPLLICVHIMASLIKLISSISCEAAVDNLHPQIGALGLERCIKLRKTVFYAENKKLKVAIKGEATLADVSTADDATEGRQMPPLAVSDEAMRNFQERWQNGWIMYETVLSKLWPMQNILFLWTVICLLVPSSLALKSYFDPDYHLDVLPGEPRYIFWLNALRVTWIWAQGPVFFLIEHLITALLAYRVERTAHRIENLLYLKPTTKTMVDHVIRRRRPARTTSLRIPATPVTVIGILVLFLVSGVPWIFVRWTYTPDEYMIKFNNTLRTNF